MIERYLPAEISDDELGALVDEAIAASRRRRAPATMGKVMGAVMPKVGGRADGKRVSAMVRERLARLAVGPPPADPRQHRRGRARGLGGHRPARARGPTRLRGLPARQRAHPRRRGRRRAASAATMVDELVGLVERGHDLAPATIDTVTGAIEAAEKPGEILEDVIWRHRAIKVAPKTVNQKRYVDSIRRHTVTLRDRPGRHRQDLPRGRDGGRRARGARGQPDHPHPTRGRGRRAARLPARRHPGEGRPLPAPAVRRALRHARPRAGARLLRPRGDRGRAAGIHARPHPQRLVRDPRRGAEHEPRADEDVPHPARVRLEDGRHRRHHPDRPAARPALRAGRRRRDPRRRSTTSPSSASAARTSSATSSCSGSSPPTASTRSATKPG